MFSCAFRIVLFLNTPEMLNDVIASENFSLSAESAFKGFGTPYFNLGIFLPQYSLLSFIVSNTIDYLFNLPVWIFSYTRHTYDACSVLVNAKYHSKVAKTTISL